MYADSMAFKGNRVGVRGGSFPSRKKTVSPVFVNFSTRVASMSVSLSLPLSLSASLTHSHTHMHGYLSVSLPEQQLQSSLQQFGEHWELNPGDGAFYGPKVCESLGLHSDIVQSPPQTSALLIPDESEGRVVVN